VPSFEREKSAQPLLKENSMNISGIDASVFLGFRLPSDGEDAARTAAGPMDKVDISLSGLSDDEEAAGVFGGALSAIAADPQGALAAHSGLTQSRVFALLGM
jgi:hypothetical protein